MAATEALAPKKSSRERDLMAPFIAILRKFSEGRG